MYYFLLLYCMYHVPVGSVSISKPFLSHHNILTVVIINPRPDSQLSVHTQGVDLLAVPAVDQTDPTRAVGEPRSFHRHLGTIVLKLYNIYHVCMIFKNKTLSCLREVFRKELKTQTNPILRTLLQLPPPHHLVSANIYPNLVDRFQVNYTRVIIIEDSYRQGVYLPRARPSGVPPGGPRM